MQGPDKYANGQIFMKETPLFFFTFFIPYFSSENVIKAYLFRAWDQIKEYQKVVPHLPLCSYTFLFLLHFTLFLSPLAPSPQTFAHPSHPQLLPDTLPPPYQRPYTLIIEMNDILLHTNYDVMQ